MEKEKNIHRQEYLRKMRENGFLLQVQNKPGLSKESAYRLIFCGKPAMVAEWPMSPCFKFK